MFKILLLRTSPRFFRPIGTKPLQKCSLASEYAIIIEKKFKFHLRFRKGA